MSGTTSTVHTGCEQSATTVQALASDFTRDI